MGVPTLSATSERRRMRRWWNIVVVDVARDRMI